MDNTRPSSPEVTAAFINWHNDQTPRKLNEFMIACEYPIRVALQRVAGKLRRRRPDLDIEDMKHAGRIGIWETITRKADTIAEHARHYGMVRYLAQNAEWEMLSELRKPKPTTHLNPIQNQRRAKLGLAAERVYQETGNRPADDEVLKRAGLTQGQLAHIRVIGRHAQLDSDSNAWTPAQRHRDFTRMENRELIARVLKLLSPQHRWLLRHRYLLGEASAEMQAIGAKRYQLVSLNANITKAARRAKLLAEAQGLAA